MGENYWKKVKERIRTREDKINDSLLHGDFWTWVFFWKKGIHKDILVALSEKPCCAEEIAIRLAIELKKISTGIKFLESRDLIHCVKKPASKGVPAKGKNRLPYYLTRKGKDLAEEARDRLISRF